MNALANSDAVSPSHGDVRGDGLMQRTPKRPQDRFADTFILADAKEETRSNSNAADEADLGTGLQCEQRTLNARKRAGRSTEDSSHAGAAVIASDKPTELSVQTKRGVGKGDSTSARFSQTPCEELVATESPDAGHKKRAAILSQHGKNEQHTHIVGSVARKNGGFGALLAGPSALKENLLATSHALDEPSRKALSRRQSPVFEVSPKSEGRLRGAGSENQPRAGFKRGSASGSPNHTLEALLSRGKETQPGSHKSGASAATQPSACSVSQPAAAGPHTSAATAIREIAEGGVSEGVSQSVGEQILDSLKASMAQGDRQVLIRLQPPELGMVLVRFREQGERLDGTLQVDRTDTRREIEQALPEVVRSLQEAGIGIRRLDVTDADPSGQDLGGGQPQQDGSSGHRHAGQDRDHLWTSSTPWSAAAADFSVDSQQTPNIQGSTEMPRGRIDMFL
jgi:flagellar hook-length control protein FliK